MDRIITAYSHLHNNKVIVNDRIIFYQENIIKFADFVKTVFKQEQIVYPRFYKMDAISKLGFLATELVLKVKKTEGYRPEAVGVVLSNSSSSLDTDIAHNETIKDRSAYFPSPSVFVYTLPNIVIGEVCIKNNIKGENAFLISETFNGKMLFDYVEELFTSERVEACLCGWVEVMGNNFNAMVALVEKIDQGVNGEGSSFKPILFNVENLNLIMTRN
ncbi:MAG: 3-oxoacyl-ACP synthase [Bacteroidota bacterium]